MSLRILALDIETSPALKWGYGMFNQNYGLAQIERKPGIIGWASRWETDPANSCLWYDGPALTGYVDSLDILWDQMHEATHILHFNGRSFDTPWVNHEFIKYGIGGTGHRYKLGAGRPPSPYKEIDLMREAKRNQRSLSNKLQFLSTDLFALEGKIDANALTLWLEMYHAYQRGDMAAYERSRAKMARYCIQDTNLLPKVKKQFLPWLKGIQANLYSGHLDGCPNCGRPADRLERRGYYSSGAGNYQRYRCKDCGTWSKSNRSEEMSTVRNAS